MERTDIRRRVRALLTKAETKLIYGCVVYVILVPVFAAAILTTALATPALAQGGTTVESAPALSSGVTVSGNTAADSVIVPDLQSDKVCMSSQELWSLNLAAGDQVLVKGALEAPATGFAVEALPPGVTDSELLGASPIAGIQGSSDLTSGLSFAAPVSGKWIIVVGSYCGDNPGPYQLSATVTPVTRPPVKIVSQSVQGHSAHLTARTPTGGTITAKGQDVVTGVHTIATSGDLTLTVKLSKAGLKALKRHHHRLRVTLTIVFKPRTGKGSSTTITLTFT